MNAHWRRGFETAKAASLLAIAPKVRLRVGAALFSGTRLLSIGFNSYGVTHPASCTSKNFSRNVHRVPSR
jgi:deoxycytidylate deaminase